MNAVLGWTDFRSFLRVRVILAFVSAEKKHLQPLWQTKLEQALKLLSLSGESSQGKSQFWKRVVSPQVGSSKWSVVVVVVVFIYRSIDFVKFDHAEKTVSVFRFCFSFLVYLSACIDHKPRNSSTLTQLSIEDIPSAVISASGSTRVSDDTRLLPLA